MLVAAVVAQAGGRTASPMRSAAATAGPAPAPAKRERAPRIKRVVEDDDALWNLFDSFAEGGPEGQGAGEVPRAAVGVEPAVPEPGARRSVWTWGWNASAAADLAEESIVPCAMCKSRQIIQEDGHTVCGACFTIREGVLQMTAEWRFFQDDGGGVDPSRCGMPTSSLLPNSSFGSMVASRRGETRELRRVRLFQMWNSMPYWERTLYQVFETISIHAHQYGITQKILEDAKHLYKQASEKKISRGANKEGLIASCVYFACMLNHVPRHPKEVAKMFHIPTETLTKGIARFQQLMPTSVATADSADYVGRFGSQLQMSWADIEACKRLARRFDEIEVVSQNAPTSIAAGAIYYFCNRRNIPIQKRDLSAACAVSDVTTVKLVKRLQPYEHLFADLLA